VKRIKTILLSCFALIVLLFSGLVFGLLYHGRPPSEDALIENFSQHRAAFEQLRNMLMADTQVRRVAVWGVDTIKPLGIFIPPAGNFPVERFNQYVALLKQAGGKVAFRSEGAQPEPSVIVWAVGFGGDIRHIGICWEDLAPTNQVPHLYGGHQTSEFGENCQAVYRHLDGNWYLWKDW
jgi:hypothetical protein